MREMKDSNVEWIGEIPTYWKFAQLGYYSEMIVPMRDKPTAFDGDVPWIRIEDLDGKYVSKSKTRQNVSKELIKEMNLKVYPIGTVLCSCSCSMGTTAIVKKPLMSNQTFIGIVPNEKFLDSLFLYYLMNSSSKYLDSISTGAIQQYLSRADFEGLRIPIPTLQEQQRIANFLDHKTAQLDSLISSKEKQIYLLNEYKQSLISETVTKGLNSNVPMKESGVEWIGEIPEHWILANAKYYVEFVSGEALKQEDLNFEEGIRYLRTNDIYNGSAISKDNMYYSGDIKGLPFKNQNDYVICFDGFNKVLGKGTLALFTNQGEGLYCSEINKIVSKDEKQVLNRFAEFSIGSERNLHTIVSNAKGSIVQHSGHSKRLLYLVVPPFEEQRKIVDFLDHKTSKFDSLITQTQSEIEKLKEYKQSLIFEAVTGKIEIELKERGE